MPDRASSNGARRGEWWPGRRGRESPRSELRSRNAVRVAGRLLLWVFLGFVFARGVSDMLGGHRSVNRNPSGQARASFPTSEARTFAVRFAWAYFAASSGERGASQALRSFFARDLSDQAVAVRTPLRSPGTRVAWAMVAREAPLGSSRALITVAVSFGDGHVRYLTVPTARDSAGGLVVYDLPSFSAPPRPGDVDAEELSPLSGQAAQRVIDLVGRFTRAYIAGASARELTYFLAPRARVARMPSGLRVVSVDQVDGGHVTRGGQDVLVSVRVRDNATGEEFPMRYRLRVVRHGRWYVAAIAGGPGA